MKKSVTVPLLNVPALFIKVIFYDTASMNYFASTVFLYMSFPEGEKKKEGSQIRGLHMYSTLFFSSQQPLTPEVVVQLVPKHVEQGHD